MINQRGLEEEGLQKLKSWADGGMKWSHLMMNSVEDSSLWILDSWPYPLETEVCFLKNLEEIKLSDVFV